MGQIILTRIPDKSAIQIPAVAKAVTLKIVFVKTEPVDIQNREAHPEVRR